MVTDLTIRDAFAIAALTGLLSSADNVTDIMAVATKNNRNIAAVGADISYEIADAMIEARKPDPLGRHADGTTARFRNYLAGKGKS